nr:ribonuclease domain-containing protein [Clostridium novyi]
MTPGSLPVKEEKAVLDTVKHIELGSKPSGKVAKKWGIRFGNREGFLPKGTYREYRVAPELYIENA